jgi:16S rRNA processing protein RimM
VPDDLVVGTIASIDDTTANILFELENGRLIPANDDLIVDIDTEHRQIRMNIPEGLLDI